MPKVNASNFLDALATYLASGASLEYAGLPRALFTWRAVEGANCTDPYSVLRIYGGPGLPWVPVMDLSIQCMTTGSDPLAAMNQAVAIHGALTDAAGRPLRMVTMGAYRVNGVLDLTPPGVIGVTDNDKTQVAFNFRTKVIAT